MIRKCAAAPSILHECTYLITEYDTAQVIGVVDVKDNDGQIIFTAEGKSGHIHHTESEADDFGKGKFIKSGSKGVFLGVCGVNTIYAGTF